MAGRVSAVLLVAIVTAIADPKATAADLQPRTVAAFDRYVRSTENRLTLGPFLWIDGLPQTRRADVHDLVRRGRLHIEPLLMRDGDREFDVPGGLVHHWVGTAFVPGATPEDALMLLQDYDQHQRIYAPAVARSRVIQRDGDRFQFFLRFRMTKIITVVVNSEHEARFSRPAVDRAEGWIHSTRIAEVENAGESDEREKPVGHDGGYLWRLNTYWRLLARDGGLYIQCESVSLTRGIPTGFGWLVGRFVTSIPRESLTFTLETTRTQLTRPTVAGRAPAERK